MDRKLVQIYLSKDEYDVLKSNASKAGMSIADYIRSCTIKYDSGIPYYLDLAINKLDSISHGSYFSLSTLIGEEWPNIPRNIKSSLGKQFFNRVCNGDIYGVEVGYKNSSNVQLYKKI